MINHSDSLEHFFTYAWDWDLSKILGCATLALIYTNWTHLRPISTTILYLGGVILLFLALSSPLDALSDEYLFSAHMFQHILLLMVIPELLILGLPEKSINNLLKIPAIARAEQLLNRPIPAWIVSNFILWIWHVPRLYDWAISHEGVHIFQHLSFLVSATVFWWPVLAPVRQSRLPPSESLPYLLLAALSNMTLGIALTFLTKPIYNSYQEPEDSWKILNTLRTLYHLDTIADQRLGGVLMWVLGSTVFLAAILAQFSRWYRENEAPTV